MRQASHWLRYIGLMIEMLGIFAILREWGGKAAWVVFLLGFLLWLVGRILMATTPRPRRDSA